MEIKRYGAGPRFTQAVRQGDTIYIAGQVADGPSVKAQTEAILKKIDALLQHFDSHKSKILSATVYLADMATYDEMNAAWDAWVERDSTPARATVQAAGHGALVEIVAIASA